MMCVVFVLVKSKVSIMLIVIEGVDATGKSTLAQHLSDVLGRIAVIPSEGPPRFPGEINMRLERYSTYDDVIFDRHPAISQLIYQQIRPTHEPIDDFYIKQFYERQPLFIYCDPGDHHSMERHRRSTHDTDEHITLINIHFPKLISFYRMWAVRHAQLWYRIGDNKNIIISAASGVWNDDNELYLRSGARRTTIPTKI
jgi:hypothetical protein